MDILAYDKTLTSQFLMPLLFEDKKFKEIITDFDSFVNAYIADFDKPNNDNKIVLVFNKKQKDLPKLNRVDHYTKLIKDGEEHFLYVYEIPKDLEDNYTSWLIGRYSLFTERAKQIILNFWDVGKNSMTYGVLYKTGKAIKDFYKDNFNASMDETFSSDNEDWWIQPKLVKEIYGAS